MVFPDLPSANDTMRFTPFSFYPLLYFDTANARSIKRSCSESLLLKTGDGAYPMNQGP